MNLMSLQRLNLIYIVAAFSLYQAHFVGGLQAKPELLRGSEELCQSYCCVRGNPSFSQYYVIYARSRNVN